MNFITLVAISNQTVIITPRYSGQILRLGATEVVTRAEEPVRIYGAGTVELGEGWWDNLAIIEGEYTGPWFDGSNAPAEHATAWTGTPNASTSVLRVAPEGAVFPGWAPGVGVPQIVVGDPQQTIQLATSTEVRSDYTITIREVG